MKLSAPIYRLKRKAKLLSQQNKVPLYRALDSVAASEGFGDWSLLAAKLAAEPQARKILARLHPGDLLILGARPGHGKTRMGLELAVEATKAGSRAVFFTLEYTERDVQNGFGQLGVDVATLKGRFAFDGSDTISANHIVTRLEGSPPGTLAVIDYLQLLDQKRDSPALDLQMRMLKSFASAQGTLLVFLSQIDRSYDGSAKPFPDLADFRLPNPLDLAVFNTMCFLNRGEAHFARATRNGPDPRRNP